jgi:Ca2+-binding RTX toxin-like protein
LDPRLAPAVTATFTSGVLSVVGDNLDNSISVSRNTAGQILVNGGAVAVQGGTPTVANTTVIQVDGGDGNDTIALNEANGILPTAILLGGNGDDVLTGGSASNQLHGGTGNDILRGNGGPDRLSGEGGNDTLIGGAGADSVDGGSGDDRIVWNPGDDTDLIEGGDGTDTVEVNGGNGAETFTVTANGTRVRFDRVNPAPFALDIGTSEKLVLNANGGNDSFSATGNLATLIQMTVDGGAGNDTLLGSNGADFLFGGTANDFIDGQQGNDTVFLGAGNDIFQWDPGDGSDTVEGQAGTDTMHFNGSAGAELFEASANGGRVLFTRNLGTIVMDLNDVEAIDLNTLGNTDQTTVNDLSGTDVTRINVHLAVAGAGDAQRDIVVVKGTGGNDAVTVTGAGTAFFVKGLHTLVAVDGSEGAFDQLNVDAFGGNDKVNASTLAAGVVGFVTDGGTGNDSLIGSAGIDFFIGGDGNDFVDGNQGNDGAQLGTGDDTFVWNPGDGNDLVEGEDGTDTLVFNGSAVNEAVTVSANGSRLLVFRDVDNVSMDTGGVERVDVNAKAGKDAIVVSDLTGTAAAQVNLNLGVAGVGDGSADTVVVNGTAGNDAVLVTGSAGNVAIAGLAARVNVFKTEAARDQLTVNALDGQDVVDATALAAGVTRLVINGGLGADIVFGSPGNDVVNGGDGNDVALMGAGNDTFVWNPGDDNDTIEGEAGLDTMLFNGAIIAEHIDILASGGRVLFVRDVASVTMDLNDVEAIDFNALGGADTIVVNDLSGTDLKQVNLNLAGPAGVGDGAADTVVVTGTNGNDGVKVSGGPAGVVVAGLTARVKLTGSEGANDQVVVKALAGNDRIDASALAAGAIKLTADGGVGDDTLIGSAGVDTFFGGDGDDLLVGNAGQDSLDGGPGDNVVRQ